MEEKAMSKVIWRSEYFCGNKISDYGINNKYVDYATLAKSFDCILNNDIIAMTNYVVGEWETVNGYEEYYEDNHRSYGNGYRRCRIYTYGCRG